MTRCRRRAFTLLELAVVLLILAVLASLGTIGVCKVREAAARVQCANNLHQLALSAHNCHDSMGYLPSNPDLFRDVHGDHSGRLGTLQDMLQPYLE
jgi:prepilin-type N-terminal cleavage/methylation domain-containing protein